MKNKNYAKKVLKLRLQKDWTLAITIALTFLFLDWFDEIDWSWCWLASPIWILSSIYFICTAIGVAWYYSVRKKEIKD